MSYDRQLDQLCPHLVVEELLTFEGDRQTVIPVRPISSLESVKVRLNGAVEVPFDGVLTTAQVRGTKTGPFTITQATNELRVRVHGGAPQVVTLPVGTRIAADKIAYQLNRALPSLYFSVDRGAILVQTQLSGPEASFYILGGSTLCSVLGLPQNRNYRGQQVVPGWTLVNDPNTLLDRPVRMVVFDKPLRGFDDFIEVNYTTIRQECRRCGGLGVENDWRYGQDGNVVEVRDEALLIQEMMKATYTAKGSNPFHPWYGSSILEQVGQKISASGLVQNIIVSDIYRVFQKWQEIKTDQEQKVGQFVSDAEFPFQLLGVNIEQSQQDPTVFYVNVDIRSRSLKPIQLSRGLRVPQPTDLLGSTAAQGVFRQSLRSYSQVD
jgi:hypothetical protein